MRHHSFITFVSLRKGPFFVHFYIPVQFSSVAHSCLTLCDPMDFSMPGFLVHHQLLNLAQTRPLRRWCCQTISSSDGPFSSCLQSIPASGSYPMNQFFASGSQSIGISASASVLPMNIQDWFPLDLTGWISLQAKGLSRVFNKTFKNLTVTIGKWLPHWTPCL